MNVLYPNIRMRREQLGMTQLELAEKVGYRNRSAIARIESGQIDLPAEKIAVIADALKVRPGVLFEENLFDEEQELLTRWGMADEGTRAAIRKLLDMPQQKKEERSSSFIA